MPIRTPVANAPGGAATQPPTGSGTGSQTPPGRATASAALKWSPPVLTNPTTIHLGTGQSWTWLRSDRDYILKLPPGGKLGATAIEGGRNVIIEGGHITVPAGTPPGVDNDWMRNGIYVKNTTGTVHIEGVEIDGQPSAYFDGIDINAPQAIVQVENVRIDKVRGSYAGFHGDIIQPWGGVRELRIDHLTGTSDYQGLQIPSDLGPNGAAVISDVNLSASTEPTDRGGHLLWVAHGSDTCNSYPISLTNVYVQPRTDRTLTTSIWPASNANLPCAAEGTDTVAGWPSLAVHGQVRLGLPVGGDFVPRAVPGDTYVSPGYESSQR